MITLRPYQADLKASIYEAWRLGADNVLAELACGGGKTVIFSDVLAEHNGASVAIAHRRELVGQISLALARDEVRHRIIAPLPVVKYITGLQHSELGTSFYDPSARTAVAGVDTLLRRKDIATWAGQVTLWVQDEGHHVLRENKWGKAAALFPHARGLGVTATPLRADGKGLGRHHDGLMDALVSGPPMRSLIKAGHLTDYRIFAPSSDLDLSAVVIGASGDFAKPGLTLAVRKSHIVGDVVEHYKRIAPGKLGITFATDVETARQIAAEYNAAGVPAAMICAETPDAERTATLRKFKRREILQLVNVDLFGEGFDLPALEVVSFARPTQSFAVYAQQFGRALRPLPGKTDAIVIDHVGNVQRHGLPDAPRTWSLDRRDRRHNGPDEGIIPIKVCARCTRAYERTDGACPYCGFKALPVSRSGPEFVDGDLLELDAEALARMRGEIEVVDKDVETYRREMLATGLPPKYAGSNAKRHAMGQQAQAALRESMAWWGMYRRQAGQAEHDAAEAAILTRGIDVEAALLALTARDNSRIYRRFYLLFGVDMMGAQALGIRDALGLMVRINKTMGIV